MVGFPRKGDTEQAGFKGIERSSFGVEAEGTLLRELIDQLRKRCRRIGDVVFVGCRADVVSCGGFVRCFTGGSGISNRCRCIGKQAFRECAEFEFGEEFFDVLFGVGESFKSSHEL